MTNAIYNKGREGFAIGAIAWLTGDIRAVLVDAQDYTVNLATHQYLSDIPVIGRVALSATLTGKTATDGICYATGPAPMFPSVTGDQSEAVVLCQYTGTDTTSRLIAYIDTATGLPVTPNGGNISVTWDTGVNKIFKL